MPEVVEAEPVAIWNFDDLLVLHSDKTVAESSEDR